MTHEIHLRRTVLEGKTCLIRDLVLPAQEGARLSRGTTPPRCCMQGTPPRDPAIRARESSLRAKAPEFMTAQVAQNHSPCPLHKKLSAHVTIGTNRTPRALPHVPSALHPNTRTRFPRSTLPRSHGHAPRSHFEWSLLHIPLEVAWRARNTHHNLPAKCAGIRRGRCFGWYAVMQS